MAGVLRALLQLLEERLDQHDENRKEVQSKLQEICSKIKEDADALEEKISGKISENFEKEEEETFGLIEKLNRDEGGMDTLMKKAKEELSYDWKYEIRHLKKPKSFADSFELKILFHPNRENLDLSSTESVIKQLQEHLEKVQGYATSAQRKLTGLCNGWRKRGEELETRINGKLEEAFKAEDARIQSVVKMVRENIDSEDSEEVKELIKKAKLTFLKKQKYELIENGSLGQCDLKVGKEASLEPIGFEERKPTDLIPSFTEKGKFSFSFSFFDEDEEEVLKDIGSIFEVKAEVWEKGHKESISKTFTKEFTLGQGEPVYFKSTFTASTMYCLKMRIVHQGMNTQWSDETEFTTPEFKDLCVWKKCSDDIDWDRKYFLDKKKARIASKINARLVGCTVIANTLLPPNRATSWNIKILKSKNNKGEYIFIGVAPSDINQNEDIYDKCGWYFNCFYSALFSGPPHRYRYKEYGPRKSYGQYVRTGDSVGVVMDTAKGELSFALNGVNLGIAFEGIPLDKPLVPCVILYFKDDSVELVF